MTIPRLSPQEVKERFDLGFALLVDIREPDEFAREHIVGARSIPLSRFDDYDIDSDRSRPVVVFMCQSGSRTCTHFRRLATAAGRECYAMAGGLTAWKAAGLPTDLDRSQPIEMQRQVKITAGTLVLLGLVLALAVSPWFIILTVFIGCSEVFAGLTGRCALALVLRRMPWNASMR